MESESANFETICMLIAFADCSRFVLADDPERLAKLERLLDEGGKAIGLIAIKHDRNTLTIGSKLSASTRTTNSPVSVLKNSLMLAGRC